MSNAAILWNKLSDAGVLSGGSWASTLPLAHLQNPDIQRLARSTSAAESSTRFRVDLGSARTVSTVALLNHNLTTGAQWRVVVTSDAADTTAAARVLDTGMQPAWVQTVVFGARPYGAFPWDMMDPADYPGGTLAIHRADAAVIGRYVWVYLSDAANPAGYVQAGRLLVGAPSSPRVNWAPGGAIRWVDPSEAQRTRGGRRIVASRPRYRAFDITFEALSEAEAMGMAFEIGRGIGVEGDFLLMLKPAAPGAFVFRQTIYAAMTDIVPAAAREADVWTWGIRAEELI